MSARTHYKFNEWLATAIVVVPYLYFTEVMGYTSQYVIGSFEAWILQYPWVGLAAVTAYALNGLLYRFGRCIG